MIVPNIARYWTLWMREWNGMEEEWKHSHSRLTPSRSSRRRRLEYMTLIWIYSLHGWWSNETWNTNTEVTMENIGWSNSNYDVSLPYNQEERIVRISRRNHHGHKEQTRYYDDDTHDSTGMTTTTTTTRNTKKYSISSSQSSWSWSFE
jgi:hypothetical protein